MTTPSPLFKTRAFQIDLGRQPERLPALKRMVASAARFGFNQCHLYLENSLRLEAFGPAGRGLSKAEMIELIAFADGHGVEIVPSFNLLGHAEHFLAHDAFKEMDEIREGARQPWQAWHNCFCPSLPRTRAWVKEVIDEAVTVFPSTNMHVGLDETWTLGSCPLCRKRAAETGLGDIFATHAAYLNSLIQAHNRRMWMWADMCFYYEGVLERLPREIVMVDWYYDRIAESPLFSFRNWRAIDSTRQLVEAGFTVVPGSCVGLDNVRTFARYAAGLDIDTFLVTNWEGSMRFPDGDLPRLCLLGNYLKTGTLPDWQTAGAQLLPERSEAERQTFFLALHHAGEGPGAALDVWRSVPDDLQYQIAHSNRLQQFVQKEVADIVRESDFAARQVLRRGGDANAIFAPLVHRLAQAQQAAAEWQTVLEQLATLYGETEDERAIYGAAKRLTASLHEQAQQNATFCVSPSAATFPGKPVALVLNLVGLDPCAHACRIDAGSQENELETVYDVNALPLRSDGKGEIVIPLTEAPRFVRLSINGYARVGVASLRCRTLNADLLPKQVVASGGMVNDTHYLLEWDRKAALFNEPDVATVWLKNDVVSDNFVLLEFNVPGE